MVSFQERRAPLVRRENRPIVVIHDRKGTRIMLFDVGWHVAHERPPLRGVSCSSIPACLKILMTEQTLVATMETAPSRIVMITFAMLS